MLSPVWLPLFVLGMPFVASSCSRWWPRCAARFRAALVSIGAMLLAFAAALPSGAGFVPRQRGRGSRPTAGRSPRRSPGRPAEQRHAGPGDPVSLLVQIYSLAYLGDERPASLGRYYTYQSLFAFSMLGLVLAPASCRCSSSGSWWALLVPPHRLLVRRRRRRAAVKAFWITKLGDIGFIIGIVLLWSATGTFEFTELFEKAQEHALAIKGCRRSCSSSTWAPWASPPSSAARVAARRDGRADARLALIHAATMVTAGVFMVTGPSRCSRWFRGADADRLGRAFTALLARRWRASRTTSSACSVLDHLAARVHDGRRGRRAAYAGFLHLLTHGLFKALLFLAPAP